MTYKEHGALFNNSSEVVIIAVIKVINSRQGGRTAENGTDCVFNLEELQPFPRHGYRDPICS